MYENELIHETSPYLLQHAHNPVHWYPWNEAAFAKAREEDKPIFLSIGYSTCHWCHVMAHESFEDEQVAELLNNYFISIKVDKEERPDIDGVYMRVCQAFTGSGGWPTSIFMSADGKPFFAGTYFPKEMFMRLLNGLGRSWQEHKKELLRNGEQVAAVVAAAEEQGSMHEASTTAIPIEQATTEFQSTFDFEHGGFGPAPKFPMPHNLMFLLHTAPQLAEKTLEQMYRGGIFDHIGGGFCRYSTDEKWLAPHFEKMLYDNALLAIAYLLAYEKTKKPLYRQVAERIFVYLERDLRSPEGGFYAAQDADAQGEEGKYYLFTPAELIKLLGQEQGTRFCHYYDITEAGNFEGKNIPNLLHNPPEDQELMKSLPLVYAYRKGRMQLHTDHKQLTAWNSLTVAAYALAARVLDDEHYLAMARQTLDFIERELVDGDTVYVSYTNGKRSGPGFLDDYAFYIYALIHMHQATLDHKLLTRAVQLTKKVLGHFADPERGGYFFSGEENERLIARNKDCFDGAIPSGNSVMAYNLTRLATLTKESWLDEAAGRQQAFMNSQCQKQPLGYSFYLYAMLPTRSIICHLENPDDLKTLDLQSEWIFQVTKSPTYPLANNQTTFYICEDGTCKPPVNQL